MKKLVLVIFIIFISIPVFAASGVSNSTRSKVEGTMRATTERIKESNSNLKGELLPGDKKSDYVQKNLEEYQSNLNKHKHNQHTKNNLNNK